MALPPLLVSLSMMTKLQELGLKGHTGTLPAWLSELTDLTIWT
jgi:hypothetical protein